MDSIGAEVGQKMRSAIKAKLMELDCYVDDELPDYIMVMVANRRTKSQMNEDLNLFLSTKTSTFVNWLHIVLKKLKEVTVTNPEVYKKAIKRKSIALPPDDKNSIKVKREKTQKGMKKESQSEEEANNCDSITDDLPISPNKLADNRKVIISDANPLSENIVDNFDIPLLSEVNESINEQELQDIEKKIRNVKSRLGLLVESDNEDESLTVKPENDESVSVENEIDSSNLANARQISILDTEIAGSEDVEARKSVAMLAFSQNIQLEQESSTGGLSPSTERVDKPDKLQHKRITFESNSEPVPIKSRLDRPIAGPTGSRDRFYDPPKSNPEKRRSVLDRLGKRLSSPEASRRTDYRQSEERHRSGDARRRSSSKDRDRSSRLSERLGGDRRKRDNSRDRNRSRSRDRGRDRSPLRSKDRNQEKEPRKEGILNRVGVQSKIAVIKKPVVDEKSEEEEEEVVREVRSAIKVKPRVIASNVAQPNKNLLLKAVAEAQRSIAQTPKVGKEVKPDSLFTKKYSKNRAGDVPGHKDVIPGKVPQEEKNKLKALIRQSSSRMRSRRQTSSDEYDSEGEYIPRPLKKVERDVPSYIPSSKSGSETESRENDMKENCKHQFIITLDGIEKLGLVESKSPVRSRPETAINKKRSPSPIVFHKPKNSNAEIKPSRPDIPDKLPVVHPPLSIKNKERCRYWPGCRQGDKCEFVHPSENCQLFPQCKFGVKCLFLHPKCKFGISCTKRECPYDHHISKTAISSKLPAVLATTQTCKFFPNCANVSCPFYHPKPCKYGEFCNNILDCSFSHAPVVSKKNLSWRSK